MTNLMKPCICPPCVKRLLTALALAAVLIFVSVAAFCDKQSFISNARTAYQSYQDAGPLFAQLGLPVVRLNLAASIANDLVIAFEQNQNALALTLVAALIQVVAFAQLEPWGKRYVH